MSRGKSKGNNFERTICKQLSRWWAGRDDIFWRTASSGGMSTQRGKRGKSAKNQQGDIQATDPIGQPLIDLCTIELKRGYSSATLSDFIDGKTDKCQLQKFIEQAITDCRLRDDESEWILIVKRDYKEVILFTPIVFYNAIPKPLENLVKRFDYVTLNIKILKKRQRIMVVRLDTFLKHIKPEYIKRLWELKHGRKDK